MLNGLLSRAEINHIVIKLGDFGLVGAAFQPRKSYHPAAEIAAGKSLPRVVELLL
jgi:hypothetical protein